MVYIYKYILNSICEKYLDTIALEKVNSTRRVDKNMQIYVPVPRKERDKKTNTTSRNKNVMVYMTLKW